MQEPSWVWLTFYIAILALLLTDLFLLNKEGKVITIKKALITSAFWIALALFFNYLIYIYKGKEAALNFLAAYLIEEALSIDNLFVFITIFSYFHTPKEYQHKVLFWGILGAIIMRGLFIFFGIALVNQFQWILYIFGIFLIYTGIKMAWPQSKEIRPENNPILKLASRILSVTPNYEGKRFFVRRNGKWYATPLFIVLLTVESTDVVFAVDSIPAVMAITRDPFIIYTSNIFAILGLRSLYFALEGLMSLFHYLNYGLAIILTFVGIKMLLAPIWHVPIGFSLGFIVIVLALTIVLSLLRPNPRPFE